MLWSVEDSGYNLENCNPERSTKWNWAVSVWWLYKVWLARRQSRWNIKGSQKQRMWREKKTAWGNWDQISGEESWSLCLENICNQWVRQGEWRGVSGRSPQGTSGFSQFFIPDLSVAYVAALSSPQINSGGTLGRSADPQPDIRRQRTGISTTQKVFFSGYL